MTVRCAQCGTVLPATNASIAAAMGWPHSDPGAVEAEAPKDLDPRTVIDDRVRHLLDTEGDQFKARMYQQLNLGGMTEQKAHAILRKLGLTQ